MNSEPVNGYNKPLMSARSQKLLRHWIFRCIAGASAAGLIGFAFLLLQAASEARLVAPEPSLLLIDRHGRFLGEMGDDLSGRLGFWPVERLPPRIVAATLIIEDRHFWKHPGLDPVAMIRAIWQNFSHRERISGASTIAMQVARIQNPGPRTYLRKARETLSALLLTWRYGREAVLAHYLRIAPYGNRIRGIVYAARRYLDKPVLDLSWAETAFLVALPQAPGRMNPYNPEGRWRAVQRGKRVLQALLKEGVLLREEYLLAVEQIEDLILLPRPHRPEAALHAILRLEKMLSDPKTRQMLSSSPVVHTTLDLDIQKAIVWRTFLSISGWEDRGAGNAAVMVLDSSTHNVLAYVGSTDYFDAHHAGAIDYARVPRSPGSTLKPFIYGLALEHGMITPATIMNDLHRSNEGIGNDDNRFFGPLLPRVALANSRNIPAVDLLNKLGLDEGFAFLGDLGFHDHSLPADYYGLGLALGALPVTLDRLVRAYTVLTGEGRLYDPVWYLRQPVASPRRFLSEETARQITLFLSDPLARLPSFPRMGSSEYPFPVAVKTGTSKNWRDAWTVAWSRKYLVGVWIGHPDYRPMQKLSGFRAAAVLARHVMLALHPEERDGLLDLSFPPPRGFKAYQICALTGLRATDACDRVFLEFFRPGQEPVEHCNTHLRLAIDTRNGLLATSRISPAHIEVRTFTLLKPQYAAWAANSGQPGPPRKASPLVDKAPVNSILKRADNARASPHGGIPGSNRLMEQTPASVQVVSPGKGIRVLRDPETPPGMASLALEAVVDPPAQQLVWYLDGKPFKIVDYPYSARWPLVPGKHTFQARVPFSQAVSALVTVNVN